VRPCIDLLPIIIDIDTAWNRLAAFAHYVIFAPDVRDTLCCVEAWDYCRDVLLLVLSRHFLGENEPLALTVCPSVCRALLRLLRQADSQAGDVIL
jgi:hypothetical protein